MTWVGALAVILVAVFTGSALLERLTNRLLDKNILAFDKAHGTNIHSNYLLEDRIDYFDDYCSADRKKLATLEKERFLILSTVRNKSRREALNYVIIFPIVMLGAYLLLVKYLKQRSPSNKTSIT